MKRRIGILTSGGDCPGLNATIRGVAKACYEMLGSENVEIVGISDGYYGLIHNMCKEMKPDDFPNVTLQHCPVPTDRRYSIPPHPGAAASFLIIVHNGDPVSRNISTDRSAISDVL